MINSLLIDNQDLLSIIDSCSNDSEEEEFLSLLEYLYRGNYRIALYENDSVDQIYERIYKFKFNDNIQIISLLIDKLVYYITTTEFATKEKDILMLGNNEGNSIKDIIIRKATFNFEKEYVMYSLGKKESIRKINTVQDMKEILFIFLNIRINASEIIDKIKKITGNLLFDEDIFHSIEKLNDGFEKRKHEIIHHLYCIDSEIPRITQQGISSYIDIGTQCTIDCSPERNRKTVENELIKVIDGLKLNCELHTKMENTNSRAPDRIYFCPKVPEHFSDTYKGKIYIYKITGHV